MSDIIAFIGVGNMGNPMAENLLKSGKKNYRIWCFIRNDTAS